MILLLSEQNSSEKMDTEKYISHITGKLSKVTLQARVTQSMVSANQR